MTYRCRMPKILPQHIVAARAKVEPLSLKKAEAFADSIFATQPNLLASVLVLPKFGVTNEDLDVVLMLLFICFESVRESGTKLPTITEEIQERCLLRIGGKAKFIEGLSASASSQAVSDQVASHPEPNLIALCYGMLRENDLASVRTEAEKHLLLASLNIAESIAYALNDA
ncbi:MAG: hypothetical protein ABI411_18950 [Tahibacter sp.]